jgi:hypothetical protein
MMKLPEEKCVGCGAAPPKLEEEQTLRSTLGWRLVFEKAPDGTTVPIWRCPTCWQKKKVLKP